MSDTKRVYHINKVSDRRGTLSVASLTEEALPFVPKRVFWITDVPENAKRGEHAHKTCDELLFVLSGRFTLVIDDGEQTQSMRLEQAPDKGVIIRAGEWCELLDFAPGTVLVVFASEEYDDKGYIHSHDDLIQWRNKG